MIPRPDIRGKPAIMFCRILMFMWSFGTLEWRTGSIRLVVGKHLVADGFRARSWSLTPQHSRAAFGLEGLHIQLSIHLFHIHTHIYIHICIYIYVDTHTCTDMYLFHPRNSHGSSLESPTWAIIKTLRIHPSSP